MEPKTRILDTLRKIRTIAELFEKSGMFPGAPLKPSQTRPRTMPTDTAVRALPTPGIIKNTKPPKEPKPGLKAIDEICTADAQNGQFLITGNHVGVVTIHSLISGERQSATVAQRSEPIRAIGIGPSTAVVVSAGSVRKMNLKNIYLQSDVVDLKKYLGTDRSRVGYARFAAVRLQDEAVYAILFGDGAYIVVNMDSGELMKRGHLENSGPRGLCFVGMELHAFDDSNRRYVIEY